MDAFKFKCPNIIKYKEQHFDNSGNLQNLIKKFNSLVAWVAQIYLAFYWVNGGHYEKY